MQVISFQTYPDPCAVHVSENGNLTAIGNRKLQQSPLLGLPSSAIYRVLGQFHSTVNKVQAFIHAGWDHETPGKCLQDVLRNRTLPQNYRPLVQVEPDLSTAYFMRQQTNCTVFIYYSFHRISCFELLDQQVRRLDLHLDKCGHIAATLKNLYEKAETDPESVSSCFANGNRRFYDEFRQHFFFDPNGRIAVKDNPVPFFIQCSEKNRDDALLCLCKITEDIFLHLSNYIAYVTGVDTIAVSGDFNMILSTARLLKCTKNRIVFDPLPEVSPCLGGIPYYDFLTLKDSLQHDLNRINELAEHTFTCIRKHGMEYLKDFFKSNTDPIFIALSEAFNRCSDPEITFKVEDIIINNEGVISWLTFLFFIFGKDSNGYPYIVNHKGVVYLSGKAGDWEVTDVEFTVFSNDPILTVELTSQCNFRCIMCDQSTGGKREKAGFMKEETIERITDSLSSFPVSTVTPFWLGESTLHQGFAHFLEKAFEQNKDNSLFANMTLNTNASLLSEELSETILKCGSSPRLAESTFLRIHFSVDALTKETFHAVHGSDSRDETYKNIEYFLKRRMELGLSYPKVTVAFIIMQQNRHEAKDFLDHWKKLLNKYKCQYVITWDWPAYNRDAIYLRRLDCEKQKQAEDLHREVLTELSLIKPEENKDEERLINTDSILMEDDQHCQEFVRRPCPGLWLTPIINWNGEVTVCCFDIDMELSVGNINDQKLDKIWDSPRINFWRLCHIRGDFHRIPRCASCANLNAPTMKNADFVRYLLSKGLKKEIQPFLERIGKA